MTAVVTIRGLTARRGREIALENVDLDVFEGEIHGLAGPNGGGKTTLLRCLLGTLPFSGTIRLGLGPRDAIGYVPQALFFDASLPISVADFFALSLGRTPVFARRANALSARIEAALAETGASPLVGRQLSELSGGELRRVLLAQALVPEPRLLVLDEPASHVDEDGSRTIETLLLRLSRERRVTVLLVEHDLALLARVCTRVTFLNRRIVPGDGAVGKAAS
ncbi:MAG: metal ABC transporter ATP-binding protein [Thermoanaerobaculia bacterium]|nr:metal ABC transporter ATP-binding protein [Thermoanaerobaculia bacterium]